MGGVVGGEGSMKIKRTTRIYRGAVESGPRTSIKERRADTKVHVQQELFGATSAWPPARRPAVIGRNVSEGYETAWHLMVCIEEAGHSGVSSGRWRASRRRNTYSETIMVLKMVRTDEY
ncbi:hypothetical protein Tco_0199409 [Tanacetum coccineum]